MVPLKVLTLIMTGPGQPSILVLAPVEDSPAGKSRIVPIWIGQTEATLIGIALEEAKMPRPTTHDLFLDALTELDTRVDHVLINDMKGPTFYSQLSLRQGPRLITLDARPSDALALALKEGAPFYIDDDLLEKASYPFLVRENIDPEETIEDFKTFLEDLTPEDFTAEE